MLKKQLIIDAVNGMQGEEIDLDELSERLYLLQKLNEAEGDMEAGRIYSNEQIRQIIQSWRQSPGQTLPKAI